MSVPGLYAGGGGAAGYQVQRSVRLRKSATASMSRTPGVAGNRKLLARRIRIKRGELGTLQVIMSAGTASIDRIYFDTSDRLCLDVLGTTRLVSTRVFRDPIGWLLDIELQLDVANGTAAQRAKLLVDGVEISAYSTDSRASITNTDTNWNNTAIHYLGRDNAGNYFDGYMAEPIGVDGSTASTYTSVDATSGQQVAARPSATWGTTGYSLDFSDATSLTTLMADRSGNGNNWTANNISLTAGATYDSMLDVPLGGGGNERGNYATLNQVNGLGATSNGALTHTGTAGIYTGRKATMPVPSTGKWYWEYKITAQNGAAGFWIIVGMCTASVDLALFTGGVANAIAYGDRNDSGGIYNEASTITTSGVVFFVTGDVLQCAYDPSTGKFWFGKNNVWWDAAVGTTGDPSSGINQTLAAAAKEWFPYVQHNDVGTTDVNFGQRPFTYTPPAGFKALHTGNLPTPTGAALEPHKHFGVKTRAGTGAVATVTGIPFAPGLIWAKARNNTRDHGLYDYVRGTNKALSSNLTSAEQSLTNSITAFNADGYALGSSASDPNAVNLLADTYVDWLWKAGGAAVTNNAGSITSQVSANVTAGFSIVTWTGSGSNATIGHGLAAVPKLVINKPRNAADNWPVYHGAMTTQEYVHLNLTNAKATLNAMWNNTAPTSTVFNVGTNGNINTNTQTMVSYCFAEITGYSKIDKYTGNGSADGPFVYCGFRPRWVMVKRTDSSNDWHILDSARDTYNPEQTILAPNSASAEGAGWLTDFTANGFKLRGATTDNTSGATYIFMAIAESPLKYSNAR